MNVRKVKNCLKKYAKYGLCSGILIKENGNPDSTIGCVMGCLAVDTVNSLSKKEFCNIYDDYSPNKIIDRYLKNQNNIKNSSELENLVKNRFNLNNYEILNLIYCNDCINSGSKFKAIYEENKEIPEIICKIIYDLRKKYISRNKIK